MNEENKYRATKQRVETIRLRTWTLTLAILITLALYLLVNVTTKQSINKSIQSISNTPYSSR